MFWNKEKRAKKEIFENAKKILERNWVSLEKGYGYTRPAPNVYPFQWNWDSGFIAYGYLHYDTEKAISELRSLFKGQWSNGFLPHIIFHTEADGYFPNYDFWNTAFVCDVPPKNVRTSGITQPPLHATVIWHIYEKLKKSGPEKARLLLEEFYPKLYNLHKYFYTARDPEGWGLITIYHPWESGFDNSPRWDETLSKIAPKDIPDYKRLDTKYVNSKFRPNDEEYDKYVYLALELKKNKYDDKLIYSEHQFKIKDKVCSSILYLSNKRLRQMAEILGEDNSEINEWIRRFEKNLMLKLWNENDNLFYDYDLISEKPIKIRTVGALMPLMTGLLSEKQIDDMTMHLDKANFCGSASCAVSLIPSAGVEDQTFNHEQYWRGPIWINVNWFLLKGFEEYGMKERAEHLRTHILKLVIDNGFWEYYSPIDGHGLGAESFSWTAALAIDLLQQ